MESKNIDKDCFAKNHLLMLLSFLHVSLLSLLLLGVDEMLKPKNDFFLGKTLFSLSFFFFYSICSLHTKLDMNSLELNIMHFDFIILTNPIIRKVNYNNILFNF